VPHTARSCCTSKNSWEMFATSRPITFGALPLVVVMAFPLLAASQCSSWSNELRYSRLPTSASALGEMSFDSLAEAKAACEEDTTCHGITKVGGDKPYTLRGKGTIAISFNGESSWIKTCAAEHSSSEAGIGLNIHQPKSPHYLAILILVPSLLLAVSCTMVHNHTRNWGQYAWIWLRYCQSFSLIPFKFGFHCGKNFITGYRKRMDEGNPDSPFDLDSGG